jgi:hypothetical protein
MPNSSKTCKVGEAVDIAGTYECLICKYSGTETLIKVERGKILPICATCKDTDTTWHIKTAS